MEDILSKEYQRRKQYLKLIENKSYQHAEEVWHRKFQGKYISDVIYGANDGIITTFAVIAGSVGATLSPGIIVILGLANLLADGFSMGASNFLSIRSEQDFYLAQKKREEWEVDNFPEIEKEEVRTILRKWGVSEDRIEDVLNDIISDKERWIDLMMKEELELQDATSENPFIHALVTFLSFVGAGFLPLMPYLFLDIPPYLQFKVAIATTSVVLFGVGSARSLVTTEPWFRSGLEMLFVGGIAAALAYSIGWAVKSFIGLLI